jgi:hypothetical protein
MSDDKWGKVDAIVRQQEQAIASTGISDKPLAPINEQIDAIQNQELDLIGRFKRNSITRKAALESLRAMHDARLEAAKHALLRAVDVEKQRIDTVADKYIFQITADYLRNMRELGLQNFESRMDTLLQLNETSSRLLERVQAQDIPSSMRDTTIENILRKHKEFSDRLMEEEIKLSK